MSNSTFVLRIALLGALFTMLPLTALAQPRTGQIAAGGDIGIYFPKDEIIEPGWIADGFLDFYLTPRIGIRPIVTAIRNGYEGENDDDERQLRVGVDVIYNWEGGRLHPFVGAGVGVHWLKFYRDGDNAGPDDTNFGANLLGGVEIFMNTAWTVKLEGRYQFVSDRPHLDPDGLGVLVGLKRYF